MKMISGGFLRSFLLLGVVGALLSCQSVSEELTSAYTQEMANAVYLQKVIPPCTPIGRTDQDPCAPANPGSVWSTGTAAPKLVDVPPSIADVILGKSTKQSRLYPGRIKHIVVRGTVQPETTRCQDYYLKLANYWDEDIKTNEGLTHVHCFADVRVNEYYVGEGPPVLTGKL